MSSFVLRPASRQGIVPLIVFYSESGCGKTYSSLLVARGLAGPSGKIAMIDTENGRGELYSDLPEFGGYGVIRFDPPFSPSRYIDAMDAVEKSGAAVGIIDSGSHEWEGVEGVLDLAAANEQKSGKAGLHNWKNPKFEHAKFVSALLRSKIPWIVCLRAKYKSHQVKENGKTVIIKDAYTSPIQDEGFIFEATCHGEIMPDHSLRLTKWSHPSLKPCFPVNAPVTIQTGEAIAKWCITPGVSEKSESQPVDAKALKAKLWTMTKKIHGGDVHKLEKWLREGFIIPNENRLEDLTGDLLVGVIEKANVRLSEVA